MKDDITGGAAYPRTGYRPSYDNVHPDDFHELNAATTNAEKGMTLLDYFAGQALNGLVAMEAQDDDSPAAARIVARTAYLYAAQMIEVRKMVPHVVKLCECNGGGQVGEVPPIPSGEVLPPPPSPPPFGSKWDLDPPA